MIAGNDDDAVGRVPSALRYSHKSCLNYISKDLVNKVLIRLTRDDSYFDKHFSNEK